MSDTLERPQPVAGGERVALIDVLRGFALYGVLIANMVPWFSGRAFLPRAEAEAALTAADNVARFVLGLFVFGKAMGLLMVLFGAGFAIQLERAEARGRSLVPTHLRRMAALAVIGVCHVLLLWWGDILTSYAIGGVFLLFFRKTSIRATLLWAAFLIFVPRIIAGIPAVSSLIERVAVHPNDDAFNAEVLAVMRGHDRLALTRVQVRLALTHMAPTVHTYIPWLVGNLLLGAALGRSRLLMDAAHPPHKTFFKRAFFVGLAVAITSAIAFGLFRKYIPYTSLTPPLRVAVDTLRDLSVFSLDAVYIAGFALLSTRPSGLRRVSFLAPVGRMALSVYLMQSLVCTTIFYGFGFGLIGKMGPALAILLSLVIFAVQAALAPLWFRYYRFGPMEWVWRTMTYGRLRRAPVVTDTPPETSP